ncbi:MAG: hypothetical protein HKN90_06890 [Flavobacteriaceae bacterium]|nr:hypothetical protein [Flavobacteriaceae bacterium]
MSENQLITIEQICTNYGVPNSFIDSLREYELIEIITTSNVQCVHHDEVVHIEKMMRMYYDLNINMEGLDVVRRLLHQVETLQNEVNKLNNRLKNFEAI